MRDSKSGNTNFVTYFLGYVLERSKLLGVIQSIPSSHHSSSIPQEGKTSNLGYILSRLWVYCMKVVLECFVHRCFDLQNLGLIDVGSYDVTKLKDNIYVL